MLTNQEATKRLTNRWNEQVETYPAMRQEIPLELYVARNLQQVAKNDLLARYARR